jgi:hypothetical protein
MTERLISAALTHLDLSQEDIDNDECRASVIDMTETDRYDSIVTVCDATSEEEHIYVVHVYIMADGVSLECKTLVDHTMR